MYVVQPRSLNVKLLEGKPDITSSVNHQLLSVFKLMVKILLVEGGGRLVLLLITMG